MVFEKLSDFLDKERNYMIFTSVRVFLLTFLIIFGIMDFSYKYSQYWGPLIFFVTCLSFIFFGALMFLERFGNYILFAIPMIFFLLMKFSIFILSRFFSLKTSLLESNLMGFCILSLILSLIVFLEIRFKNFRNFMYFLSILFILIDVFFLVMFVPMKNIEIASYQYCDKNSDCGKVSGHCSPLAINKNMKIFYFVSVFFKSFGTTKPFCYEAGTPFYYYVSSLNSPSCINKKCTFEIASYDICEKAQSPDDCYKSYAIGFDTKYTNRTISSRLSACEKIVDNGPYSSANYCKDSVYSSIAYESNNATLCDNILDQSKARSCRNTIK